jgi:hypothetical protein
MNLNNDPRGLTACLCKAGLALGDGAKTGTATAAPNGAGVDYCIKGIVYHLADAADNIPLTAAPAQGLLTSCLYAICIDADGTRLSVQGNPVLTADMVAGAAVLDWPLAPADYCVLGYVRVDTASTANFTPGTTALDAANVTETYIDVFTPPIEPLLV